MIVSVQTVLFDSCKGGLNDKSIAHFFWINRYHCGTDYDGRYFGHCNPALSTGILSTVMVEKRASKYYVVEFRFPLEIRSASSPEEAARKASQKCESKFGFRPHNWYARVFEYAGDDKNLGVTAEYFSSPGGTVFREIEKNFNIHDEYVEKGIDPSKKEK